MIYSPRRQPTEAASAGGARRLDAERRRRSPGTADACEVEQAARRCIGRSRECDIQLEDANVSRRHAELRQEGAAYWIVDLDSTNGDRGERPAS